MRSRWITELNACAASRDLTRGRRAHADAILQRAEFDIHLATSLVSMYCKCGSIDEAAAVFHRMPAHSLVSLTAFINGLNRNKSPDLALHLFSQMRSRGCSPDARCYSVVLNACLAMLSGKKHVQQALEMATVIESEAGADADVFLNNTLLNLYCKCGDLHRAAALHRSMPVRNTVSYSLLMLAYTDKGHHLSALNLLITMLQEVDEPDGASYVAALKVLSGVAEEMPGSRKEEALRMGVEIHRRCGGFHLGLSNTAVDLYGKCRALELASWCFSRMPQHSLVSFTVMMEAYSGNGDEEAALTLFQSLPCPVDSVALVAALKACGKVAGKEQGREVEADHGGKSTVLVKLRSLERGMSIHAGYSCSDHDDHGGGNRVGNTLVDMYAACGSLLDARLAFDRMEKPDTVSWNALLLAYTHCGYSDMALRLFSCLAQPSSYHPSSDSLTLAAVLKASASSAALDYVKLIHSLMLLRGSPDEDEDDNGVLVVISSLVDAYGKCGNTVKAQMVFDSMLCSDRLTTYIWSTLIAGYSQAGDLNRGLSSFRQMQEQGFEPDGVVFLSLLAASSHAGDVKTGERVFRAMPEVHKKAEHYRCMVDLLARGNRLDAAFTLASTMPFPATVCTWRTILAACWKWSNVKLARLAFEKLMSINPTDHAAFVLMEKILAAYGLWEEHSEIRGRRIRSCRMNEK